MSQHNGNYVVNWQALLQHVAECDRRTLVSMIMEISQVLDAIEERMKELALA